MGTWLENRAKKAQATSERRNAEYLERSRHSLSARDLAVLGLSCGLGYVLLPLAVWIPLIIAGIAIDLGRKRLQRRRSDNASGTVVGE